MIMEGYTLPHPPIIVSEIGHGEEEAASQTIKAYEKAAERIAAAAPELIILTSPHTTMYRDWFNISQGTEAFGSFSSFGAPSVRFHVRYDTEFVDTLQSLLPAGFPAGTQYDREQSLTSDQGTMVPLYFINKQYTDYKLVRIGLSGLPLSMHYQLGQYIKKAVEQLGRRAVFVASGDLSHCGRGSHYGYHPEGPEYDRKIIQTLKSGNLGETLDYDEAFLRRAEECGHRSFTILAGAFDKVKVKTEVLSYESPWGIGYGVCIITPQGPDKSQHVLEEHRDRRHAAFLKRYEKADEFVKLAYDSVRYYTEHHRSLKLSSLPDARQQSIEKLMNGRAGVFVSIHKDGDLRGCIGTIAPCYDSIAQEIIQNGIAACSRDPRFPEITTDELDDLEITVDVLSPAEKITDRNQLDVHRYGVICSTADGRRGLLLPDLDGVDTVDEQISIACRKGGINEKRDRVILERFEVIRHY